MRVHVLLIVAVLFTAGCMSSANRYYERHQLKELTVVFLDQDSLRGKYMLMSGRPATSIHTSASGTGVQTVKGFFDFETNTLYCSKMDFEVCGHELHHAIIGHFHPD
ncbi:MAG TPA: hypothetical protein VFA38_02995 [Nitrospirales bacterium]|nr:hypothetical protein [Nitrospirales bacterium]